MKILFFCASLDAGRDGVGDYTRLLAEECVRQGHTCGIVALHDPAVSRPALETADSVPRLRLPAAAPWSTRLNLALRHQHTFSPDWVSWQLVAYGFHPRGLVPPALERGVARLRGPRCHAMLHELWLGLETGSTWRARATGWLQRRGVLRLLARLGPDRLHTSNASYQTALHAAGYDAGLLSLFGNVPVPRGALIAEGLLERWLPIAAATEKESPLIAVTFGTLHPQWQPARTVAWLKAVAGRLGRTPMLLAIGRTGPAADILNAFAQQRVRVGATGELDPRTVSDLFRLADFGIAPHPWALIAKSGAAAAMLDHGLPVVVPRDDWHLREGPAFPSNLADPLLKRLGDLNAERFPRWLAGRRAPQAARPRIAASFLQALAPASPVPATFSLPP